MQTVIIGLLALLTFGNPLLLVFAWFQKLTGKRDDGPGWRTPLLWVGLPSATIAVLAFWVGTRYAPTSPGNDLVLWLPRPRPAAARSRLGQDDFRGARLWPMAGNAMLWPAIAISPLVLGLNLLADGVREISLRD